MAKRIIFSALVYAMLASTSSQGHAQSISAYQDEIEKIFLKEAAQPNKFKKAVQTARLLGFLEFLPPEGFSEFHRCLKGQQPWDILSDIKREKVLNLCRSKGRWVSSAPLSPETVSVRPSEEQKREQQMKELRSDILELRSTVEKLSQDSKLYQTRVLETLRVLSSKPEPKPAEMLQSFENY